MNEFDRCLAGDDVTPSDDFTWSVMRAVRQEQKPKPIPFPWTRVLPGFVALLASLAMCIGLAIRALPATQIFSMNSTSAGSVTLDGLPLYAISWVVIALALTYFSIALSVRIRGVKA